STGEECDPGPVGMDGCGAPSARNACRFDPPDPVAEVCPGLSVHLGSGQTLIGGTTLGYSSHYDSLSCTLNPGLGADRVYQVIPDRDGMLTARVGTERDGVTVTCSVDLTQPGCW